jgi:hypothetical protein
MVKYISYRSKKPTLQDNKNNKNVESGSRGLNYEMLSRLFPID